MKTCLCAALALLLLAIPGHAMEDVNEGFLLPEHRYHFVYLIDQKTVSADKLPPVVTIVRHAQGGWYVVKSSDRDAEYWINLAAVAAITEIAK